MCMRSVDENQMATVRRLADEVERGLSEALPRGRKTVVRKLALAVGAMLEGQTSNTVELANLLPLATQRQDMREQWLRRLLKNPLLQSEEVMAPFAREELLRATRHGQTVLLSMDQTDRGDRMVVLMVNVRVGDRSLPLAWVVEAGAGSIGFEGQQPVLERVLAWLPEGAPALLSADRFYPSAELFAWLHAHHWHYRLRLKGDVLADPGAGDKVTTAALAQGVNERYLPQVQLFTQGILTNLGILHEPGHNEPWIIAMDCAPTRAAVLDFAAWWAIGPAFTEFKRRGFRLEDSQLEHPHRLERLILIMTLAMYWCVHVGQDDASNQPTPLEQNSKKV